MARSEASAWRDLAPSWASAGAVDAWAPAGDAPRADPCRALQKAGLQCFRGAHLPWATVRQLNRPGILTLYDRSGQPAYAVLSGIGARGVVLSIAGKAYALSQDDLALWWRGDFATLWKTPPGYAQAGYGAGGYPPQPRAGAAAEWLVRQLGAGTGAAGYGAEVATTGGAGSGAASGVVATAEALRSAVYRFQLKQALPPDGVAGPITLMHLNRTAGVAEPRLHVLSGN